MLGRARRVDDAPAAAPPPAEQTTRLVVDVRSVWVAAWIVVCVVALALFVRFVFADGGSIFFSLALAFFFALAIEPLVRRLARRMPRAAATGLTFVALAVFVTAFFATFGRMLTDQLAALVQSARRS